MEPLRLFRKINRLGGTTLSELPKSEANLHFSDTLVGVHILRGRLFPTKVLSHAIKHQTPPRFFVGPERQSPINCSLELFDIIVGEYKPCPIVSRGIVFLNRVGQATSSADDGYSAIAQAVHLIQPARLVFRRHKKDVRTRFNQVSASVIKFKTNSALARMALNNCSEVAFGFLVSAPEQHEIQILRKQIVEDTDDEVETFLDINAGNHRKHRQFEVRRVQTKFFKESSFVVELS